MGAAGCQSRYRQNTLPDRASAKGIEPSPVGFNGYNTIAADHVPQLPLTTYNYVRIHSLCGALAHQPCGLPVWACWVSFIGIYCVTSGVFTNLVSMGTASNSIVSQL